MSEEVRATLVAHSQGWEAPESQVRAIETPPATRSHRPLPHAVYLDRVREATDQAGLIVRSEQYALARKGAQLFGVLKCQAIDDSQGLAIGLRNSHDKSLSAGLIAGMAVFVCDNLAFSGEVQMRRKHTRFILQDLPHLMRDMLAKVVDLGRRQAIVTANMQACQLQPAQASHIMIESVRQGIWPASKLPKVIDHYDSPQHEEFAGRNVWSLYNAYTETNKGRSPQAQISTDLMAFMLSLIPRLARA